MAGKKGDLAIIGDRDSVLLAKAVGLAVFDETDPEKASRLIHRLAREEYKVIFLTEPLFAACGEAVAQYKSETFPAIIPIPGRKGTMGLGMTSVKKSVERAVGADILFRD